MQKKKRYEFIHTLDIDTQIGYFWDNEKNEYVSEEEIERILNELLNEKEKKENV